VRLLLDNRVFLFSNLAALANYSATAAVGFLLSLYLQYIHCLSPRDAGLVLMVQPLVMAALMHGEKITPAVVPRFMLSLRVAFGIFAALCVVGVFASLARGRHLNRA